MTVRDAIHIFQISQKNIHRKRITDSYRYLLEHLENHFTDSHVEGITPDHIYQFLEALTGHVAKSTRRLRNDRFLMKSWQESFPFGLPSHRRRIPGKCRWPLSVAPWPLIDHLSS